MRRAILLLLGCLCLIVPDAALATIKTTELVLTPQVKAIKATWSVNETTALVGWQVKDRKVGVTTWTTAPELEASAREYTVTGLEVVPYEVRVVPRYEAEGKVKNGSAATATATPLAEEGEVLWLGDGSKPLYEQWASVSDQEHCAIDTSSSNMPDSRVQVDTTSETALRFAHKRAIRFLMKAGDTGCYSGRTELGMGHPTKSGFTWGQYKAGAHIYTAFEVAFGSNFPLNDPAYPRNAGTILQFHTPEGSSSVGLFAGTSGTHSEPKIGIWGESLEEKRFGLEVKAGVVYKLLLDVLFEPSGKGYVHIWESEGAGELAEVLSLTNVSTLNSANEVESRIGWYADTLRTESKEGEDWFGGYTAASSRAAAEASAFH